MGDPLPFRIDHLGPPGSWKVALRLDAGSCEIFHSGPCSGRAEICDPTDYTVHGILQARMLEWVAFPFSRGSSQPRDRTQVSCIAGGSFTS